MGDHREMLLDLSVDEANADTRVREVRTWLRSNGWSEPAPDNYDYLHSKQVSDGPGPRLKPQLDPRSPHFVFSFIPGRGLYVLGDSTAGPMCRQCGQEQDIDEVAGMVGDWLDSDREPDLTCPGCSWRAPWGDWDLSWSLGVSSFAVVIDQDSQTPDPQDFARQLKEALQADLGGRWVLMHYHD